MKRSLRRNSLCVSLSLAIVEAISRFDVGADTVFYEWHAAEQAEIAKLRSEIAEQPTFAKSQQADGERASILRLGH